MWFIFQFGTAYICLKLPDKYFSPNSFLFKERKWESGGKFYSKVFKVTKWKGLLPDGGAAVKGGYKKKTLSNFSDENLEKFLVESCRGELTHLLAIIPFWVFGLFASFNVVIIMLFYALAVNLPCILVQRYNRPRIKKILERRQLKQRTSDYKNKP